MPRSPTEPPSSAERVVFRRRELNHPRLGRRRGVVVVAAAEGESLTMIVISSVALPRRTEFVNSQWWAK